MPPDTTTHRPGVDAATLRELAVAASCDPRTIARVLAGADVKGVVRARIERVLRERGLRPPGREGEHAA